MSEHSLSAPWRMDYIRGIDKAGGCFLCEASAAGEAEQSARLVLWTTERCLVVINRYPYTNGHLLVCPRAHKAELEDLSPDEHLDLAMQVTAAVRLLKRAISPQGFNIGANIGRCAGAGLPGHFHMHVVPRWAGDTNFMAVVGDVRVVPQAMSQLHQELLAVRRKLVAEP